MSSEDYGLSTVREVLLDAPPGALDGDLDTDVPSLVVELGQDVPGRLRTIDLAEPVETPDRIPATAFYSRLGRLLTLLDAICILVAVGLVVPWANPAWSSVWEVCLVLTAIALGWTAVFRGHGMHTPQLASGAEEFRKVLSSASVGALLTGFLLAGSTAISGRAIAAVWGLAIVLEMGTRRVARWRVAKLRKDGRLLFRTVIVGTNKEAGALSMMLHHPELGYEPVGFVAAESPASSPNGLSVVGHIKHLHDLLWEHDIECIFVASSAVAPKDMLKVTQAARQGGADVRISANIPDLFFSRLAVQSMGDVTSLALRPVQLSGGQALVKRVLDVVVASIVLVLSLPVWAAIAVAIRRGSPGPVFFKQPRVTKGGNVFTMLKFRTMVEAADQITEEAEMDRTEAFFKVDDDPRLTSTGKFLRRFSLDELPQLINVIRGEMSIVGPRPLPAEQVAANLELLEPRHEVRAGMTGWWQTNGRSHLGPLDSVRLDLFYIENWSLALDLYILLKTVGAVWSGRGAY